MGDGMKRSWWYLFVEVCLVFMAGGAVLNGETELAFLAFILIELREISLRLKEGK